MKRYNNEDVRSKNEVYKKSYIMDIDDIILSIFTYIDFKDLVEFNTVCKRWNHLTNPIIHKSIKLQRGINSSNRANEMINEESKDDHEVQECIFYNSKYTHFVKIFKLTEKLELQTTFKFFSTFRFITNLTIERVGMSQDQFLGMVYPLNNLQELNMKYLGVNNNINTRLYEQTIQLPHTLTKLSIEYINIINNPELFVETINSHNNLVEFSYKTYDRSGFLDPFYKNYPSLKTFEYSQQQLVSIHLLANVFKYNPQLLSISLSLKCWNESLTSHISSYLTNLKEFNFVDTPDYGQDRSTIFLKFNQATKIKKLELFWDRLSECSLDSVLTNCPLLEELSLKYCRNYLSHNSYLSLNSFRPTMIKKLEIICGNLSLSTLDSILLYSPNLIDLNIQLPTQWKSWTGVIGKRCKSLKQLTISPAYQLFGQERDLFYLDLCKTEFLASDSIYKATLNHLTLIQFPFNNSKAEYFNGFKSLKSIKFPLQLKALSRGKNQEIALAKNLWKNYRFVRVDHKYSVDIELIKL